MDGEIEKVEYGVPAVLGEPDKEFLSLVERGLSAESASIVSGVPMPRVKELLSGVEGMNYVAELRARREHERLLEREKFVALRPRASSELGSVLDDPDASNKDRLGAVKQILDRDPEGMFRATQRSESVRTVSVGFDSVGFASSISNALGSAASKPVEELQVLASEMGAPKTVVRDFKSAIEPPPAPPVREKRMPRSERSKLNKDAWKIRSDSKKLERAAAERIERKLRESGHDGDGEDTATPVARNTRDAGATSRPRRSRQD